MGSGCSIKAHRVGTGRDDLPTTNGRPSDQIDPTSLAGKSARGGLATVGGQIATQVLRLLGTAVLARILAPSLFGLVAMVTALTSFLSLFRDLGLSSAIVQREAITEEDLGALFWVNAGFGLVLSVMCVGLAPLVGMFYHRSELVPVTAVLGVGFAISGLAVQQTALLRRRMRFGALSAIGVASVACSVCTGIVAAIAGDGVWSLVIMQLVEEAVRSVLTWLVCKWWPRATAFTDRTRALLLFGGNVSAFGMVNYFSRNLDNVLIGRFYTPEAIAYYSRAYSLMLMPLSQLVWPITNVAVSALSRMQRKPDEFVRFFLRGVSLVALVSTPLVVYMILMSKEIVLLLLGPKWLDSALLLAYLGGAAIVQPVSSALGWLFVAQDRSDRMVKWGVASALLTVGSFVAGLPFGAAGVAIAYSAGQLILAVPGFLYATKDTPVRPVAVLRASVPSLVASLVAGALVWSLKSFLVPGLSPVPMLAAGAPVMLVSFLGASLLLPGGRTRIELAWAALWKALRRNAA